MDLVANSKFEIESCMDSREDSWCTRRVFGSNCFSCYCYCYSNVIVILITDIAFVIVWGGSRGGSGGSVEPPKVKHNTIHFLLKKDLLNNSNSKTMQMDVCPNPRH